MGAFTSLKDLLFPARVPLRDAAEGPKPATPVTPASPGIDVGAEAQKAAARSLAPAATPAPMPAPAAPAKKKKGVNATAIGSALSQQP